MTEPGVSDLTVETPAERVEARDIEDAREPVPSDDATTTEAAAASVATSTVDDGVISSPHPDVPADVPAAPANSFGVGGGEVEVECPECRLILIGESPRPTAAWFCPHCDYPMFWASEPPAQQGPSKRGARRRLPGTDGTLVLGAAPCWNCGELNGPVDEGASAGVGCLRCGATLPRPVVPEPAPRIVTVTSPVPIPYPLPAAVWPFVAAGTLAGAALAITGTLWVLRSAGAIGAAVDVGTVVRSAAVLFGGG